MDSLHQTFAVEVTRDDETGYWVAQCDALGVVTEATSYEALTVRVWQIAPEMAESHGIDLSTKILRLRFEHLETA
jgi:Domain of unknown function (DUF1902)